MTNQEIAHTLFIAQIQRFNQTTKTLDEFLMDPDEMLIEATIAALRKADQVSARR